MAEPVEVAIEKALLTRAQAFATAQTLTIALPNIAFTPPVMTQNAKYLRAYFLPAPTDGPGINSNSQNQHYGLLQVDVCYGAGAGEYAPGRIVSDLIAYFKRETKVTSDGFNAMIWKPPFRGPLLKDDPWFYIPVSIPYICFAPNPA